MAQTRTRKNTSPTQTERGSTVATTPARRVNFANIGQTVDPGEYTAVLESHKWVTSRKGDDMLTLIFKIKDHEQFANKKIYRNYMTEGDGAYYMMDALVQCGADPDELMAEEEDEDGNTVPPDLEPIIKSLYGANVKFTLGHRPYVDEKSGQERVGYDIDNLRSI